MEDGYIMSRCIGNCSYKVNSDLTATLNSFSFNSATLDLELNINNPGGLSIT